MSVNPIFTHFSVSQAENEAVFSFLACSQMDKPLIMCNFRSIFGNDIPCAYSGSHHSVVGIGKTETNVEEKFADQEEGKFGFILVGING